MKIETITEKDRKIVKEFISVSEYEGTYPTLCIILKKYLMLEAQVKEAIYLKVDDTEEDEE